MATLAWSRSHDVLRFRDLYSLNSGISTGVYRPLMKSPCLYKEVESNECTYDTLSGYAQNLSSFLPSSLVVDWYES